LRILFDESRQEGIKQKAEEGELFRSERLKAELDLNQRGDFLVYVKGLTVEKPQAAVRSRGRSRKLAVFCIV
jgi:hypothetical protein